LEHHANPSIQYSFDYDKATPLHCAAEKGILAKILLLLYFGADTTCKTDSGLTPLASANLLPSWQLNKISSQEILELSKEIAHLKRLQQESKLLAEKNASHQEQKNYAIEIGNIFMGMGNKIIKSKYGEEYYLPIAQFFYRKAIAYYTLAADFYHKKSNSGDKEVTAKYLEILKLLADLHHRTHNFGMRDYYDKLILAIVPDSKISDHFDLQWRQKTTPTKEPVNNQHFHFWTRPLKLLEQGLQKINSHTTHSNPRLT
jgi:hypothetical protein